jgi:hypothetical protein
MFLICQKIMKKYFRCTPEHGVLAHKFLLEKDIFVGYVKKQKTRENLFCSTENYYFYTSQINAIFSRDFVCWHKISRCTSRKKNKIFLTFWNMFSHNGFICSYAPVTWIEYSEERCKLHLDIWQKKTVIYPLQSSSDLLGRNSNEI